jgi:hypothetical protein
MTTQHRSRLLAISFVSVLSVCSQSYASPQRIECPKVLPDAAIRLQPTVDGWTPHKSAPLKLNSAAPTGGPPEIQADLAEFTTTRSKTVRTDVYDLRPPNPGGVWIKCGYGKANEITLHKRLDSAITQCTITQKTGSASEIDILCR